MDSDYIQELEAEGYFQVKVRNDEMFLFEWQLNDKQQVKFSYRCEGKVHDAVCQRIMMVRYLDATIQDSMHIQIHHDTQIHYYFEVRSDFEKMYRCFKRLYPDQSIVEYVEV